MSGSIIEGNISMSSAVVEFNETSIRLIELSEEEERNWRLGTCDLIRIAGTLLELPRVSKVKVI